MRQNHRHLMDYCCPIEGAVAHNMMQVEKPPTISAALFASTDSDIPEQFNEDKLLRQLNRQSGYKGKGTLDWLKKLNFLSKFQGRVTFDWLKRELTQHFVASSETKTDAVTVLRQFRQQWLLWNFWQEYWVQHPDHSCLSVKLDRLLAKIEEEEPDKITLFLLDEFSLDFGAAGFDKR